MKLAHNEQCITFYPLTADYSVGRFQPMLTFGLLRAHLFLGSLLEFGWLRSVTGLFRLWAKFSPWLHLARLWPINLLGCFHSVIKCDLLTARYGLLELSPVRSSGLSNMIPARCNFQPMYGP